MAGIVWRPPPRLVEHANVTRLMRAHGLQTVEALHHRSVEQPEWFWDAVVRDLASRHLLPLSGRSRVLALS